MRSRTLQCLLKGTPAEGVTCQRQSDTHPSSTRSGGTLQPQRRKHSCPAPELGLGEEDVLVDAGVEFDELELAGQGAGVLLLDVEGARAGRAEELDQDGGPLLGARHAGLPPWRGKGAAGCGLGPGPPAPGLCCKRRGAAEQEGCGGGADLAWPSSLAT